MTLSVDSIFLDSIPNDMVREICARLPYENLNNFKLVSKKFHNVISPLVTIHDKLRSHKISRLCGLSGLTEDSARWFELRIAESRPQTKMEACKQAIGKLADKLGSFNLRALKIASIVASLACLSIAGATGSVAALGGFTLSLISSVFFSFVLQIDSKFYWHWSNTDFWTQNEAAVVIPSTKISKENCVYLVQMVSGRSNHWFNQPSNRQDPSHLNEKLIYIKLEREIFDYLLKTNFNITHLIERYRPSHPLFSAIPEKMAPLIEAGF